MDKLEVKVGSLDFDTVTVRDYNTNQVVTYNINDELQFNEDNYQQRYLEQAARYTYWASVYESIKGEADKAQAVVTGLFAQLYNRVYLDLVNTKDIKRPTKDLIESFISQDSQYIQAVNKKNELDTQANRVKALVKGFEQRKDMLIQYGAEKRLERTHSN